MYNKWIKSLCLLAALVAVGLSVPDNPEDDDREEANLNRQIHEWENYHNSKDAGIEVELPAYKELDDMDKLFLEQVRTSIEIEYKRYEKNFPTMNDKTVKEELKKVNALSKKIYDFIAKMGRENKIFTIFDVMINFLDAIDTLKDYYKNRKEPNFKTNENSNEPPVEPPVESPVEPPVEEKKTKNKPSIRQKFAKFFKFKSDDNSASAIKNKPRLTIELLDDAIKIDEGKEIPLANLYKNAKSVKNEEVESKEEKNEILIPETKPNNEEQNVEATELDKKEKDFLNYLSTMLYMEYECCHRIIKENNKDPHIIKQKLGKISTIEESLKKFVFGASKKGRINLIFNQTTEMLKDLVHLREVFEQLLYYDSNEQKSEQESQISEQDDLENSFDSILSKDKIPDNKQQSDQKIIISLIDDLVSNLSLDEKVDIQLEKQPNKKFKTDSDVHSDVHSNKQPSRKSSIYSVKQSEQNKFPKTEENPNKKLDSNVSSNQTNQEKNKKSSWKNFVKKLKLKFSAPIVTILIILLTFFITTSGKERGRYLAKIKDLFQSKKSGFNNLRLERKTLHQTLIESNSVPKPNNLQFWIILIIVVVLTCLMTAAWCYYNKKKRQNAVKNLKNSKISSPFITSISSGGTTTKNINSTKLNSKKQSKKSSNKRKKSTISSCDTNLSKNSIASNPILSKKKSKNQSKQSGRKLK